MKTDWKTAFSYWFVHFAVEVICFYTIYRLFSGGTYWWMFGLLYDTLAFAPQSIIGSFCEKHPKFRPGPAGGILLMAGSAVMLLGAVFMTGYSGTQAAGTGSVQILLSSEALAGVANIPLLLTVEMVGLVLLTAGNCLEHISGALVTLRVSDGRLAESAIFVGGGSFGVITGRLLSKTAGVAWIPFVLMAAATLVTVAVDRRLMSAGCEAGAAGTPETASAAVPGHKKSSTEYSLFDFEQNPCLHNIAAERSDIAIIVILGLVVVVRSYIGYGLPTAWNQSTIQTICLFCFMGLGKMLGGIFSDLLGPRRVGIFTCLAAIPLLLVSNHIMWLSLIAVALFSMTMAITLGGLVSVLPHNPGIAFGITTIGLLVGSLPTFFWGMPGRTVCNILIAVMSVLAAAGLWYCLKPDEKHSKL